MSKLHICFCLDRNWIRYAQRAIYDIIIRKNPETQIKFYILLDNYFCHDFDIFNTIEDIEVVIKPISALNEFGKIKSFSRKWLGPFKHLKFLIPELDIFKDVKRVLYLDVDILARKDLTELYETDLDGYAIGGVRNYMKLSPDAPIKEKDKGDILETGMLLMDLPKLRQMHFTELCKSLAPLVEGDHWVLDESVKYNVKFLDPKFQIPYHFISTFASSMINILNWNLLFDTHYKSIGDLVSRSYLWHFCGDKNVMYKEIRAAKICFDVSEDRLAEFLQSGKVLPWHSNDDDFIFGYTGVEKKQEQNLNENEETPYEQ